MFVLARSGNTFMLVWAYKKLLYNICYLNFFIKFDHPYSPTSNDDFSKLHFIHCECVTIAYSYLEKVAFNVKHGCVFSSF